MEHFRHFVQTPSGMSRFLDLDGAIFGFLRKVVGPITGMGEAVDSAVSRPSIFLVKELVVIIRTREIPSWALRKLKLPPLSGNTLSKANWMSACLGTKYYEI